MTGLLVYVELAAAMELTALLLVTDGIREDRCVVLGVVQALLLLVCGLFFHG
jgi:drug/metabolite transporter superfamily protein YnfA